MHTSLPLKITKERRLAFHPNSNQQWTSISGHGNYDLIPGEIATHCENLQGKVHFTGAFLSAFLSAIPFAKKYGVLHMPLCFNVAQSKITHVFSDNKDLESDFKYYLKQNTSNQTIEEFGIGTNEGVLDVYGQNAGFEERHCGLHLGLGGDLIGSHHLDLIFTHSEIWFDSTCVYDGQSVPKESFTNQ